MGFVRPQIGAIPPIAEMQAMLWILTMVQHLDPSVPIPGLVRKGLPDLRVTEQWHYMLRREPGNRVGYGVDHDSYVYQLACDMDCAPSFLELLGISWRRGWETGWNIIPTWAFVSQVITKFRLRGPWKWDGAADVLHGELWTLVERNGGFLGESAPVPFSAEDLISCRGVGRYYGCVNLANNRQGSRYRLHSRLRCLGI
jgi:dimethylaniline monooxygenase (N-oxide forming)